MRKTCYILMLVVSVSVSSCASWNNQTNGAIIGSLGGAVVGAGIGSALGDCYTGYLGAQLGSSIGTVVGSSIGAEEDAKKRRIANENHLEQNYQYQSVKSQVFIDESNGKCYYRATDDNVVMFNVCESKLSEDSKRSLNAIARKLKEIKGDIYVYGSTDNVESRDYSKQLSEERARAAAGYLIACGIDRNRVKVQGLGSDSPIADNGTMAGRAMNRSVEIYVELK